MRSPVESLSALALLCLLSVPRPADARAQAVAAPAAQPPAAEAPADAEAPHGVAVVITQSIGVGPLADRLGALATEAIAARGTAALDPAAAAVRLRHAGGPDPLTCGEDERCLAAVARGLGVRRVVALGVGRFAGLYNLDLRLVDGADPGANRSTSATWAEPGPAWEVAIRDALAELLADLPPPAGRLLVRAARPGTLFVDGVAVGELPLASAIEVAAGLRQVELRTDGGNATGQVEVIAGGEASLELALAPALVDPAPAGWHRPAAWITGGTAAATLAAAIVVHAGAADRMDDARSRKAAGEPFASPRRQALDRLDTARVLYGGAAALATGAVALWLLEPAP